MSAPASKPVGKLRTLGNIAVGLFVLIGGVWWAISTLAATQESQKTAIQEWGRVQAFMDRRWSKLKDLGAAYETTRPNKIVNPFDYASGPPIFGQGTPEYTFQQYAKWNSSAGVADRIERIGEVERWMPDFLRSLEAYGPMSTSSVLSVFHRDLAVSKSELHQHMAAYNGAAAAYNQKLGRFPGSLLLKRFDLKPLPLF